MRAQRRPDHLGPAGAYLLGHRNCVRSSSAHAYPRASDATAGRDAYTHANGDADAEPNPDANRDVNRDALANADPQPDVNGFALPDAAAERFS
ncbi:MAG: hypothetical protein ACRDGH_03830 [Candidatus Limnocylindria bacterium]